MGFKEVLTGSIESWTVLSDGLKLNIKPNKSVKSCQTILDELDEF